MTIKQKTNKERETEERKGKKRYIHRIVQDDEATQEINDFLDGKFPEEHDEDREHLRRPD